MSKAGKAAGCSVLEGPNHDGDGVDAMGKFLHSLLRKEKDLDWDTKYRIALDVCME